MDADSNQANRPISSLLGLTISDAVINLNQSHNTMRRFEISGQQGHRPANGGAAIARVVFNDLNSQNQMTDFLVNAATTSTSPSFAITEPRIEVISGVPANLPVGHLAFLVGTKLYMVAQSLFNRSQTVRYLVQTYATPITFNLVDVQAEIFQKMLNYLGTDDLLLEESLEAMHMRALAVKFAIPELIQLCDKYI